MNIAHPYDGLTPDVILSAVETNGYYCTGGLLALNSYENRVYRIDTEESGPLVGKFYRPERWSDAAILEEHRFTLELAGHEIPVVAPLSNSNGETLQRYQDYRFALFPLQPGRAPELDSAADRELLGRYLGRLHGVGATTRFAHRPAITVESYGRESVAFLLERDFIPDYLRTAFETLATDLLARLDAAFARGDDYRRLRIHADCHLGNILWTGSGPHIVDFDDCRSGPSIQDLWMLLSGSREEMEQQLAEILAGYTQFADFDSGEIALIEPLRTLRLLHYSAWLARRWDDPAFPRSFPWFDSTRYWEQQILALREQAALLDEPPLRWLPRH